MFFLPAVAASFLNIPLSGATATVLRGMGGLIIGSGTINFLARNVSDYKTVRAVLITNIITHLFGISADIWGVADGVLTTSKIAPVEITHLFVGIGSIIFLLRLKNIAR